MGRKVVALDVLEPDDILASTTRQHLAMATRSCKGESRTAS